MVQHQTTGVTRHAIAEAEAHKHQGIFDISEHGWKWWFVASMNGVMIGSFIKFTALTYIWLDDTVGELEEHNVEKQDIWVVQASFADWLLASELTVS